MEFQINEKKYFNLLCLERFYNILILIHISALHYGIVQNVKATYHPFWKAMQVKNPQMKLLVSCKTIFAQILILI